MKPHFFVLLLFLGFVISCTKDKLTLKSTSGSDTTGNTKTGGSTGSVDVYVCGSSALVSNNSSVACWWKNGTKTTVTNGDGSVSTSIGVDASGNVYLGGKQKSYAVIFKNGMAQPLTTPPDTALVSALTISGNEVYLGGNQEIAYDFETHGRYWKIQSASAIPSASVSSKLFDIESSYAQGLDVYSGVNSIAISGADFYQGGYEDSNVYDSNGVLFFQMPHAVYWKNDYPTQLPDPKQEPPQLKDFGGSLINAIGITASGDIWAAGAEVITPDHFLINYQPAFWKNGVPAFLPAPVQNGQAIGLAVSGNDVYIAGNINLDDKSICGYWKNGGNFVQLPSAGEYAQAAAIAVSGSDVYICGYDVSNNQNQYTAVYWKNGVEIMLGDPNDHSMSSTATGIALAEH